MADLEQLAAEAAAHVHKRPGYAVGHGRTAGPHHGPRFFVGLNRIQVFVLGYHEIVLMEVALQAQRIADRVCDRIRCPCAEQPASVLGGGVGILRATQRGATRTDRHGRRRWP